MTELDQLKEQLIDLQSQLAFQEDTVQSLSEAMSQQQRELLLFKRQLELLKQRQDEHSSAAEQDAPAVIDQKPPHY